MKTITTIVLIALLSTGCATYTTPDGQVITGMTPEGQAFAGGAAVGVLTGALLNEAFDNDYGPTYVNNYWGGPSYRPHYWNHPPHRPPHGNWNRPSHRPPHWNHPPHHRPPHGNRPRMNAVHPRHKDRH